MLMGEALRRCARNYGDKLAVRDEYGKYFPAGASYTYAELDAAVSRLAGGLLGLGLERGDRVMLQTGTGLGHTVTLLALARAGLAMAPVDRTFMGQEIAYQVNDSGARAYICDADLYHE
jgi:acyl-CoA synthetase (AMP-forming)/AMP-acid ligase II